jgi:5-methylcytosine-specific restriction enzyme A
MPESPLAPCRSPGCRTLGPCAEHDVQHGRLERQAKPVWSAWYHIARWRQLRAQVLAASPLCVMCRAAGVIAAATQVDHIDRHHGDPELFWSFANLQGLCAYHHAEKTARGE